MASCEKCWRDAGGEPERYHQLLDERKQNPCSPEEQAGGADAFWCKKCKRFTVHLYTKSCVICGNSDKESKGD